MSAEKRTSSRRGNDTIDEIGLTDGIICDFDSEKIVVGLMLRGGNKAIDEICHYLTDLSFIHPTYKQLYRAIAAVYISRSST